MRRAVTSSFCHVRARFSAAPAIGSDHPSHVCAWAQRQHTPSLSPSLPVPVLQSRSMCSGPRKDETSRYADAAKTLSHDVSELPPGHWMRKNLNADGQPLQAGEPAFEQDVGTDGEEVDIMDWLAVYNRAVDALDK